MSTLPLKDVTFDIDLAANEVPRRAMSWPPTRFRDRDNRISLLTDLWQGDLSAFVDKATRVELPINYFRRLSTAQADVLMMSEPEAALDIQDAVRQALIDLSRYGGSPLWAGRGVTGDPFLTTVLPSSWYPREDGGHVLVTPYISSTAEVAQNDVAEVVVIEPDGETRISHWDWQHGTIGNRVVAEEDAGESIIVVAPRPPWQGRWGTSMYPDIISPVLSMALRFTQNSQVLDKNANPLLTWWMEQLDAYDRFKGASDPDDPSGLTTEEIQKIIRGGLDALREHPNIQLPDQAVKLEYVEFTGQLQASFTQIEESKQLLSFLTGIPTLLEQEIPPSGVALKRIMLPWYAATKALQNELIERLEEALSFALGGEQTVTWEHIFDQLERTTMEEGPGGEPSGEGRLRDDI